MQQTPGESGVRGQRLGELGGGLRLFGQRVRQGGQQRQGSAGGFLASLDSRLMVCIDVDQLCIQADRTLKQGDQDAQRARRGVADLDGETGPSGLGQRSARAAQEAEEVIGRRIAVDPSDQRAWLSGLDEVNQGIVASVAELLNKGVLVG